MPLLDTAGLPRAHLRTVLLLLLSAASSHGYDLLEETRHLGMRTAEAAGVYRTLRVLEHEDLVTSWGSHHSRVRPAARTRSRRRENLRWRRGSKTSKASGGL